MTLISIVIPAYNEEDTIRDVLDDVLKTMVDNKIYHVELIVANNGSSDRTAEIASETFAYVISEPNKGKGLALAKGFKESHGDIIVMLDADGSHDPKDIPLLIKKLKEGYGMVIGSRILGGSDEYTPVRAGGNVIFTSVINILFGLNLTDALNGYKAFRREIFDDYRYTSKGFEIEVELIANCLSDKQKIAEIPSHESARKGGVMKSRAFIDGLRFMAQILLMRLRN